MGWIMAQTQLNERLEGGWLEEEGQDGVWIYHREPSPNFGFERLSKFFTEHSEDLVVVGRTGQEGPGCGFRAWGQV